jgi:hypothetical protein
MKDKMHCVFQRAFLLGCRCPSEATKKTWTVILLSFTERADSSHRAAVHKELIAGWKRFVRFNIEDPPTFLLKLPMTSKQLLEEHPEIYNKCYSLGSSPAQPRLVAERTERAAFDLKCRSRGSGLPSSSSSSSSSSVLQLGTISVPLRKCSWILCKTCSARTSKWFKRWLLHRAA